MLELRDISKKYVTGNFTQVALDHVSVSFRDSEFVAILGPSGSGKTTMLNVIGGLDHFDSGDLLVDGISTKKYRDRDWDTYRNNRIGFVFQSYNLIPHQTVLANVELALTLSGVSPSERRERAIKALESVGLGDHINKKPSQLSGGQMQRVAIARALINDPEIVLADEPTGALDSATSVQVMDLLKEVSRDRLVVMVTHNPELAREYATRIVELKDGRITADSDPFEPNPEELRDAKPARRTSMSFLTALGLSFNNLMTKKGRTLMTAFAGSIGIIGIASILALANGVNQYIHDTEEETLSAYPITISSSSLNMSSLMSSGAENSPLNSSSDDTSDGDVSSKLTLSEIASSSETNDTASLKEYLDNDYEDIHSYTTAIEYHYDVTPQIFLADTTDGPVQVNPETSYSALGVSSSGSTVTGVSTNSFSELPSTPALYEDQYEVKAGRWPEAADELVLVLSSDGTISDQLEYTMGLRDHDDLEAMVTEFVNGESIDDNEEVQTYTYEELMEPTFSLVNACDMYSYESDLGIWSDRSDDEDYMTALVENGEKLHIVGVVQAKDPDGVNILSSGIYYTPALTEQLIQYAEQSEIVSDQLANPDVDVFTGETFEEEAAGQTSELDLSQLISIDSDKLQQAFTIDTSALSSSATALDLSGIQSSTDLSNITIPEIDASDLSFDASALPTLSGEEIASLFPDITEEDVVNALSGITVKYKDGGQERLMNALVSIAQGWTSYSEANPDATVQDYVASDDVRAEIETAVEDSIDTDDLESQIAAALAELTGSDSTTIEGVGEDAVNRVVTAYAEKVATALTDQITSAVSDYVQSALSSVMTQVANELSATIQSAMTAQVQQLTSSLANAFSIDESTLASAFSINLTQDDLEGIVSSLMGASSATYDTNLEKLGYADLSNPDEIDIYPIDFDSKDAVTSILEDYNTMRRDAGEDDKAVSWSDIVGSMMDSVTRIIDMVTAMLVAFVSISLVVSSIMIGVITYISVLERKKEIGILRALGASKHNISEVFNAETIIEGLVSGVMGILITLLLLIPANALIYQNFNVENLAQLPVQAAFALIGISVFLTFIAGLIPARKASHSDPVEALRSE